MGRLEQHFLFENQHWWDGQKPLYPFSSIQSCILCQITPAQTAPGNFPLSTCSVGGKNTSDQGCIFYRHCVTLLWEFPLPDCSSLSLAIMSNLTSRTLKGELCSACHIFSHFFSPETQENAETLCLFRQAGPTQTLVMASSAASQSGQNHDCY